MARSPHLISALGLLGLGLGACADNSDSIVVILQNNAPGAGCVVGGDVSEMYIGSGLIEASSLQGYVFTPVLQNFSVDEGTGGSGQIAILHGATVDISFYDPDLFDDATVADFRTEGLTHFRVPYSGMIEPGGTASMVFEIVPADLLAEIQPLLDEPNERVLLNVGVSVDGAINSGSFETKVFNYPVEVCDGCLGSVVADCSALPMDYVPTRTGGACNGLQDSVVECCQSGSDLVCPAVGTMPPPA